MMLNYDKINYLKRPEVEKIVSFISQYNIIDKVKIFGSSVTNHCNENSDIDICLFTEHNIQCREFFEIFSNIGLITNDNCDIVIYNRASDKLKQEIDKKGVVVYES